MVTYWSAGQTDLANCCERASPGKGPQSDHPLVRSRRLDVSWVEIVESRGDGAILQIRGSSQKVSTLYLMQLTAQLRDSW